MAEPLPDPTHDSGSGHPDPAPFARRPRWVTAVILGVVLLVVVVVVLHLTGNSPGGPGNHLP